MAIGLQIKIDGGEQILGSKTKGGEQAMGVVGCGEQRL